MMQRGEFSIRTRSRAEFVDITSRVAEFAAKCAAGKATVHVFVPHTTAAVTVNENADPDVTADILAYLEEAVPRKGPYRHCEGNSDAHIKASMLGCSQLLPVEDGRLVLGTWQGIYFCEFDGPRSRKVIVTAGAGEG